MVIMASTKEPEQTGPYYWRWRKTTGSININTMLIATVYTSKQDAVELARRANLGYRIELNRVGEGSESSQAHVRKNAWPEKA